MVTGSTISSTTHNTTLSDVATALTGSLTKNGEAVATANQPMGGFRHTNVDDASARTDYARADQVQDGTLTYLTSVAGTDTITASAPLSLAAYAAGQRFAFIPAGENTGATTININSIGAKAVQNCGVALAGGELPTSVPTEIIYDGTQFQIVNSGKLRAVRTYSSSTTWTKPTGLRFVVVEVIGGGGGGGGVALTSAGQGAVAGGGGGGGWTREFIVASSLGATETVTVGTGGAGGTAGANNGAAGNTSSFGAHCSATGGSGGTGRAAGSTLQITLGGAGGSGSGGNINAQGGTGGAGITNADASGGLSGYGGSSIVSGGRPGITFSEGGAGTTAIYAGSGGSGAANGASQSAAAGGAGSAGHVMVWEYS